MDLQDHTEAPGWSDLELEFKLSEAALADPDYDHHDEWFDVQHEIHLAPLLPGPAAPLLSPGSLADALVDGALAAARTTTGGATSTSYSSVSANQSSLSRRAAYGRTPSCPPAASPGASTTGPLSLLRSPLGRVASPALSRAFYRIGSPAAAAVPASPLTPHRTPMRGTALFTTRESNGEGRSRAESSTGSGAPAFSGNMKSGGPLTGGLSGPQRSAEAGGEQSAGRSTPAGERPRAMRKSIGEALRVRQLAVAIPGGDGGAEGGEESPAEGAPPLLGDPATPGAGPALRLSSALLRARNSSGVGRVSGQLTRLSAGTTAKGTAAHSSGDDASPAPAEAAVRVSPGTAGATAPSAPAVAAAAEAGVPALRLSGAAGDHPGLHAAGRRSSGRRSSEGGHLRGARRVIATEPDETGAAAPHADHQAGRVGTPPHPAALGDVTNVPSVSPAKKGLRRSSGRPPVPAPVAESLDEEGNLMGVQEDGQNAPPAENSAQPEKAKKQPATAQPGVRQQSAPATRAGWSASTRPAATRGTAAAAASSAATTTAARPATAKAPAAAATARKPSAASATTPGAAAGGKVEAKRGTVSSARQASGTAKEGGTAAEAVRPASSRPATKPAVVSQTLKFRKPEAAEPAAERSRGVVSSTRSAAGATARADVSRSGATAAEPAAAESKAGAGPTGRQPAAASSKPGGAAAASMSELKQVDPALAEILAQHNRKVKPAEFAPRLHCLKDIKDWERRAGKKYYDLSATERIAANEEMTRFKKEGVAATTA